jgi:phosphate transport system substrate-binding protein
VLVLLAGATLVVGCDRVERHPTSGPERAASRNLSGAGATFPALVFVRWGNDYSSQAGYGLNYQAVGSVEGVRRIKTKTVDFGATDEPLKPEDLDRAGLYQFPTLIGGVVPIVNVPGIEAGRLRLTGPLMADIYLGKVKSWDDPAIRALNPDVNLPMLPIVVVHRAESSGTSFLFSTYLAAQNPQWASKVGASNAPAWPTGLAAKGSDGLADMVRQTSGSIGYVEYALAAQNGLAWASVRNRDGRYPPAAAAGFAAAADRVDWAGAPGNYVLLLDRPGADTWPITGASFVLVQRRPDDPKRAGAVLAFFDWAYRNGDGAAARSDYVPLPKEVKALIRQQWATAVTGPDGRPAYVPKPVGAMARPTA